MWMKCDDEYNKFLRIILANYSGHRFEYNLRPTGVEVLMDCVASITILPCSTWREVERLVEAKNGLVNGPSECGMCMVDMVVGVIHVSCTECAHSVCLNFWVGVFRAGRGVTHARIAGTLLVACFRIVFWILKLKVYWRASLLEWCEQSVSFL